MVSIKAILISSALLATSAFARVGSMTAPDTVQAGQNITATLHPRGSLSNYDDYGVIWGLKGKDITEPNIIGLRLSYDDLYLGYKNRTFEVPVSSYQNPGDYILTAAVPYLVGAMGRTDIQYFTQNITVTE